MNKIKLMYDVVTTMRDKDNVKGILKVRGKRDETKIFGLENAFEKNFTDGKVKAKLSTEFDCDGKRMKHESSFDFEKQGVEGHGPHGFMHHMHSHPHNHGNSCMRPHSPKEGLNRLAFALSVFNSIKVEEKEDKSYVLSLNLNDIPEDIKNTIHEKMSHKHEGFPEGHGPHKFMKEFHCLKEPEFDIKLFINKDYEVENVIISAKGKQTDENEVSHDMNFEADLNLNW